MADIYRLCFFDVHLLMPSPPLFSRFFPDTRPKKEILPSVPIEMIAIMLSPEVGTYSDIREQRYRTKLDIGTSDIGLKRAESDIIIADIGINVYPISNIRHPLH